MDVTVVAYYYRVTITTTTTVERLASEQLSEDIWGLPSPVCYPHRSQSEHLERKSHSVSPLVRLSHTLPLCLDPTANLTVPSSSLLLSHLPSLSSHSRQGSAAEERELREEWTRTQLVEKTIVGQRLQ